MTEGEGSEALERALDELRRIPEPLRRLDAMRAGRERLADLEATAVRDARRAGATWKAVGALYGLSKQGAQQRFGAATSKGARPAPGAPDGDQLQAHPDSDGS